MVRVRPLAAFALMGLVSACAPSLGPPPPGVNLPPPAPMADDTFRASDFAWSQVPGKNSLAGHLGYAQGAVHYTCNGASVILTPETPWSRLRMAVLYKSEVRSVLTVDEVRSRTPLAPPGNSDPYIKRAICDAGDKFSFAGLPDGAWYAITIAKPVSGTGSSVAIMRRVTTHGGKLNTFEF